MLVSFKNVRDEALKNINFIKSQPLSTHLFHILCDKTERKYTEVLWGHTKVQWLSQGKAFMSSSDLEGKLSAFLCGTLFSFERTTDKL